DVLRVTEAGESKYSVAELIEKEHRILELATIDHDVIPAATSEALDHALDLRPALSREQRKMVSRLTSNEHSIQVVVGKAGTGKTFALDAAREAWERSGLNVIGAADHVQPA